MLRDFNQLQHFSLLSRIKTLEWKVWSLAFKILIAKIKRVPQKASVWEFKIDIFVSSEIRRINSNLHISVSEAKLIQIAVVVNTTFPRSFFPFESVNSHERAPLAQNNIKWNESNRKVVKKSQDILVQWKVSDWVGDLHTNKNNV